MAAAQKFMFGRDFADESARSRAHAQPEPEPEPAVPPEPEPEPEPEQSHTAEELEAARAQAHAEGRAAGVAEGRQAAEAESERALTQALERLAQGLETLAAGDAAAREARDRESLELCVGLLRRLFPALARKHGQGEIEQVFQDALERLRDEPRVVVRCADRHLDGLKERVDGMAARLGFEGRVVMLADETMQPGDARVEWADGGVERDSERLWQDVERALDRALAPPAAALETGSPAPAPETAPARETPAAGARDAEIGDEGIRDADIGDDGAARSDGETAAAPAPADTDPQPAATPDDGRDA